MNYDVKSIEKWCKEHVRCDTCRISTPSRKMFLIIGFVRNTGQDEGFWVNEEGEKKDWDYVQEQVIASGETEEELKASVLEYVRLSDMTMADYLKEKIWEERE